MRSFLVRVARNKLSHLHASGYNGIHFPKEVIYKGKWKGLVEVNVLIFYLKYIVA